MPNKVRPVSVFLPGYFHPQNSSWVVRRVTEALHGNNLSLDPLGIRPNFPPSSFNRFNPRNKLRDYLLLAPSSIVYSSPEREGVISEEVFIDTSDGEKLHGYFLPAKQKTNKVVIFLHGHDLNVSRWFLAPVHLQESVDVNFLIVDYRGYGKSTGRPSCNGLITDALAMYRYLIDKGYRSEDISVYGRSLGGAVALELASRVRVKSVVVQSSFSSLREIMKFHLPCLPSFLIKDDLFNSKELIKKVHVPVLISHGTNDKRVPLEHAKKLYDLANEPKKLVLLPGAGHEHLKDFFTKEYLEVLKKIVA